MKNRMRYPGPKPFAANQAHLFYGRQDEASRLLGLMQNRQLTVLYGRSGYGKSSLLNAAVLPKMEAQGYQVVNVRLGAWTPESTNTPLRSTVQAIAENPVNLEKTILDELIQWDNSLWYYTKTYAINTRHSKLLFVFDQFEELFTYPVRQIELYENSLAELLKISLPQRYRDQLKQKNELAGHPQRANVFDHLDIKVVIAIRSNRFHLLERLSSTLPSVLQNTLELDALQREGARLAIIGPAAEQQGNYATPVFSYSQPVQERILNFLTQEEKIEGILLQILCAYFERLIRSIPNKRTIELTDLRLSSGVERGDSEGLELIVDQYYRSRIDDLPDEQEETVKRFIEDNLVQGVGNGGMRLSMHQAQIKERFGIEADTLRTLVENGLLRTEPFLRGGVTYELTHDRLIAPVLKSKAVFDAGEAERLKKQLEEEEAKRKEAENLREKAEHAKAEAEAERTRALAAEDEALKARGMAEERRALALKAKAQAERNERKANLFSKASGVAVAVAAVLGIWAYINLINVRRERADKNLILCKEHIINARSLAEAGYCISALELIERAEKLIENYSGTGEEEVRSAYINERGSLDNVRAVVDNKQKMGSCQAD